jgi:hypothetical protein
MTTRKATIVAFLGAGLIALGLMTVPAHAAVISNTYTFYVGPEVTDFAGRADAECHTRGETLQNYSVEESGLGHLLTFTCLEPEP